MIGGSSPFGGSSQDEDDHRLIKNIVNGNRRSQSRSPSRKISPGDVLGVNSSRREPYRVNNFC